MNHSTTLFVDLNVSKNSIAIDDTTVTISPIAIRMTRAGGVQIQSELVIHAKT